MYDVLQELMKRWQAGESVGLATVVATFRSAPRPPGASMMVGSHEEAVGSVSGGCVEGAVYELARSVIETGRPTLQRYRVSDDDAFAAGLTCGGILDIYVERIDRATFPELGDVAADIEAGRPVALATVIDHPDQRRVGRRVILRPGEASIGSLGSARVDAAVLDDAMGLLAGGTNATLTYGPNGERRGQGMRVFVWTFAPKPRLLVFGAIDFAAAVARAGSFLGYHVTVCDARPIFATKSRFPDADEVVVDWPHRYLAGQDEEGRIDSRTVITVLTHDPKFDVPLLQVALRLPQVAYVGAMGSRRTHDDRMVRLAAAGLGEQELARLASPIGLDLGARTPEETAISIAAEITAARWGGSGQRLKDLRGRIHRNSDHTLAPGDALADSTRTFLDVMPDAIGRDGLTYDVAGRLRRLGAALERRYAGIEAAQGFHRDDVDVLVYLASHDDGGPTGVLNLRHTLGISSGNASHRMAGLVTRGWITMVEAAHDRRSRHVGLTDAGRDALESLLSTRRNVQNELLSPFGDRYLEVLNQGLRNLTQRVDDLEDPPQ